MNFLHTIDGIVPFRKKKFLKGLLCHHEETLSGYSCSESGLERISGDDYYEICKKCGRIIEEKHTQFNI